MDIARLFNLQIRVYKNRDSRKWITILHAVLAFVILVNIVMGVIVDDILQSSEITLAQKVALTIFHAIDVIIIGCYIYMYRSIKG